RGSSDPGAGQGTGAHRNVELLVQKTRSCDPESSARCCPGIAGPGGRTRPDRGACLRRAPFATATHRSDRARLYRRLGLEGLPEDPDDLWHPAAWWAERGATI